MNENELATIIVDCAMKIHKTLGPGLFESVYEKVLTYELEKYNLDVEQQVKVPIQYEALTFEQGFRMDLMVNKKVIVEIKSVKQLQPVHSKQLLTYLKLSNKKLGLLINFNEALLKSGIKRIVNDLK